MRKLLLGLIALSSFSALALTINKVTVKSNGSEIVYDSGLFCIFQSRSSLADSAFKKWESNKIAIDDLEAQLKQLEKNNEARRLTYRVSSQQDYKSCFDENNPVTIFDVDNIGRQTNESSLINNNGYVALDEKVSFNVRYKKKKKNNRDFAFEILVVNSKSLAAKSVLIEGTGQVVLTNPEEEIKSFIEQNLDVGESRLGYGSMSTFTIN